MFAKHLVLSLATVASLATAQIGFSETARADPGAAVAAGAVGLVGGLILGSALADGARAEPPPPPPDEVIVRRRPARVIEEEEVVVPPPPRCWREQWTDRWGDLHLRRVCDR